MIVRPGKDGRFVSEVRVDWTREGGTNHVTSFSILLDIHHRLLLLSFQLGLFPIEFSLSFLEGSLMLSEPFGGGQRAAEEGILEGGGVSGLCGR